MEEEREVPRLFFDDKKLQTASGIDADAGGKYADSDEHGYRNFSCLKGEVFSGPN